MQALILSTVLQPLIFIENFPNSVFCEWNSIFIKRFNMTVIFTVICLYKHVYSRCISVSSVFHFILIRSNQNLTNNVMYVPYSMSTDFFFGIFLCWKSQNKIFKVEIWQVDHPDFLTCYTVCNQVCYQTRKVVMI